MTVDEWRAAWAAALDELETDVEQAEALLADDHLQRDHDPVNPWSPPQGLGPLPLDLRPRADAILTRQLTAARDIALALGANRRHAAFAAKVEAGGDGGPRPSYVDLAV